MCYPLVLFQCPQSLGYKYKTRMGFPANKIFHPTRLITPQDKSPQILKMLRPTIIFESSTDLYDYFSNVQQLVRDLIAKVINIYIILFCYVQQFVRDLTIPNSFKSSD